MTRSNIRYRLCRALMRVITGARFLNTGCKGNDRQRAVDPSLLKKKLKSENTSYSQIITTCRMRYAVNELMMDGKNISQVSQSCGYNSTSYFISVFKDFYGMTPLHYVSQHRERTVA